MKNNESKTELSKIIKKGGTVYTNIIRVSNNGMYRHIKVYVVKGGEILNITHLVADMLGYKTTKTYSLGVSGCGMDMSYKVVADISDELFGDYKLLVKTDL